MEQCIFCQIAQKKSPAEIEYEDADVIAFWDIAPKAPVHILVIPKKHIERLSTLQPGDEIILGKMVMAAQKVAEKKKLVDGGFRLIINQGRESGQIVPHLHLHLIGGRALGKMG